jgi:hypothetical protein
LRGGPDRRSVLAGGGILATAMAGGALPGWLGPDDPERLTWAARHPPQIDMAVVNSLAEMLAAQRRVEDCVGTAAVREPVLAQLTTIEDLLRQAREPIRPALVDLAQQWAQFAAYLYRDAGDLAADRALLAQTLEWATEIGDKTMIATVLRNRGEMAAEVGDVGTVIALAQAGQQDKAVAVGQRASCAILETRGLAIAGDAAAAERKLAEAAELSEQIPDEPQDRHPWLYWMSRTDFRCKRGVAFGWLAADPRYRELAVRELQTGFAGLPEDQKSSAWAATYLAHIAVVHVSAGDTGQAVAAALQAAEVARRTGSVRLAGMLAAVHGRLRARWPQDRRVAELADALR